MYEARLKKNSFYKLSLGDTYEIDGKSYFFFNINFVWIFYKILVAKIQNVEYYTEKDVLNLKKNFFY